jgi:hydrogenase maturation protease
MSATVVIGYGNLLRGDDGVGPLAAHAVANWGHPGVRALDVPQLTPERVVELAGARRALFVDAGLNGAAPRWQELDSGGQGLDTHVSDPRGLLSLCEILYGRKPRAWLLTIPATCFEPGADLSPEAACALEQALEQIRGWIEQPGEG